jgi:ABC-type uncharacterized transport system involved in gliding motility auxiliary subunit
MSKLGQILLFVGLVFLVLWFVSMRAFSGSLLPFVWVLLGLGVACVVAAIFKDIKFFVELSGQRTTKHGLNLGVLVVIVTAVLVAVNFIGFRHPKKFDYTKEKLHSVSDQTKSVVKNLDSDLIVRGFFADNQAEAAGEKAKFKDLADLYSAESPKVRVSFINPMKRPDEAKASEITTSGTVAMEYKGRKAKFDDLTEQGFTNAIIKITRGTNKIIYFVTGHGERSIEGSDVSGAQNLKKYLTDSSYDVKPLSFLEKPQVPDDAAVVIIAGPQTAFFQPELSALKDYLYKGGKLFIALDPGSKTNLSSFILENLGIEFKNNYILDQLGQMVGGGAATAVGIVYSSTNDITKHFNAMTLFHMASQLKISKDKSASVTIDELVKSSPKSFSKTEIRGDKVRFEEGKDEMGPLTIVAQAMGKLKDETGKPAATEFQAVVAGDSDFLTNQLIDTQLNHDLALNVVSSLAKDKELVSISPRTAQGSSVTITQVQSTILYYGLVFILPLSMFFAGGAVWYRRRTA